MKFVLNLPVVLTATRIMLVPLIVHAIVAQHWFFASAIFMLAALTDLFDGLCARWLHQETAFGAALDPVADKLLVVAAYLALLMTPSPYYIVPHWFVLLVIVREVLIALGALYFGSMRRKIAIQPTILGKLTTTVQLILISCMLAFSCAEVSAFQAVWCGIVVAACLVCASLVQYCAIALKGVLNVR